MFGNNPLTLASRPVSGFLTFGSKLTIVGSRLGLLSVGYATYELYRGDINQYRYFYRASTTFASIGAAAFLGNPAGLVLGTTAIAGEMWYDGLMKYMRELGDNIGSWHYNMKRGWNPQSINF